METIERSGHDAGTFGFAEPSIRKRDVEVLVNGQIVEQVITLEDESDLFVAQTGALFRFEVMNGGLAKKVFTVPAVVVHAEDVQQGRFAGPGWAHDGNELALVDFETDVAQDIKELPFGEWINAFEIFESDHKFIRRAMLGLDLPAWRVVPVTRWQ